MAYDSTAAGEYEEQLREKIELNKKAALLFMTACLLIFYVNTAAPADEAEDNIAKVKLTSEKFPPGMEISEEIIASKAQLFRARQRVGFPLTALLNQTIIYGDSRAQVNYMTLPSDDWLIMGHSKLMVTEGYKSTVLVKQNVLIQLAASSKELEDKIIDLLGVDRLYKSKIRTDRLDSGWIFIAEKYTPGEEIQDVDQAISSNIQSMITQEFIVDRKKVKVTFYNCRKGSPIENIARYFAGTEHPLIKRLVKYSDSLVVVAESQSMDLNERVLSHVNW